MKQLFYNQIERVRVVYKKLTNASSQYSPLPLQLLLTKKGRK